MITTTDPEGRPEGGHSPARSGPDCVPASDTKEQLIRAAEHLFARQGIEGTHIREINRLSGQRNPSAVHYHFGSKEGLLHAILVRHQQAVEIEVAQRLDELIGTGDDPSVREMIEAMVRPLSRELDYPSGRDFLRIVPPFLSRFVDYLRGGSDQPITAQSARLLRLLEGRLGGLPEAVRRERLVAYALVLTTILADRARQIEAGEAAGLGPEAFVVHLLDMTEAVMSARSHLASHEGDPTR